MYLDSRYLGTVSDVVDRSIGRDSPVSTSERKDTEGRIGFG